MNPWNLLLRIGRWVAACVLLSHAAPAQTYARLSSSFLARGEMSMLEISVIGGRMTSTPEVAPISGVRFEDAGTGPMTQFMRGRMAPGRRLETIYQIMVSSYEVGRHTIPPIKVMVDGAETFTEPIEIEVFNPDDLQWSEVEYGSGTLRYASAFRSLRDKPYENETTPVEIKLYLPEMLLIDDWGIPDFEREGLAAWRFQPAPMRSRINLLGQRFVSVAYPSTVTPTRSGRVSIGPAKIRLITREAVMDPFPTQRNRELYVNVGKLELQARPLPEGAPAGFDNAVGSFQLSATAASTDIAEGDPISVDLVVSGSGNLDILHPPQLETTDDWKVYGTTNDQRGDERRQLSGTITFHQTIRALGMKSEIPPYRLVFFDPQEAIYKTLLTESIPLQMRPATASTTAAGALVNALPMPVERMTDILALVNPSSLLRQNSRPLPWWAGHAAAAAIALILLARAFWLRVGPRFRKSPLVEIRAREIREIAATRKDDSVGFLKAAGAFIERRLGSVHTPEIQAVLADRDARCFRTEGTAADPLPPKRRDEILRVLRKAALALAFLAGIGIAAPPAHAAEDIASQAREAYDAAKYDEAIQLWFDAGRYESLSADTLYNIGNACYRSGSPGTAALYYRRALERDTSHAEARQNLRFIERKYGSITVDRPDYQYALAKLPLPAWKAAFWAGCWLCVLGLLVFPATRRGAGIRLAGIAALIVGPFLISAGGLGWRYFPNDSQFAPVARQAVITGERVTLHTDAARTSPEVIDAPPGSLCEILTESGRWAYVSFATKTRGWVPKESIAKIIPETTPELPKFRKPKAGGKTA